MFCLPILRLLTSHTHADAVVFRSFSRRKKVINCNFSVKEKSSAMEVCAKLESFLEEHELNNIPEIAKRKIAEQFTNLSQLVSDLRNEKLELTAVLGA